MIAHVNLRALAFINALTIDHTGMKPESGETWWRYKAGPGRRIEWHFSQTGLKLQW